MWLISHRLSISVANSAITKNFNFKVKLRVSQDFCPLCFLALRDNKRTEVLIYWNCKYWK